MKRILPLFEGTKREGERSVVYPAFTAPSFHVSAEAISDFDRAMPYAMSVLRNMDRLVAIKRMEERIRAVSEAACKFD